MEEIRQLRQRVAEEEARKRSERESEMEIEKAADADNEMATDEPMSKPEPIEEAKSVDGDKPKAVEDMEVDVGAPSTHEDAKEESREEHAAAAAAADDEDAVEY